VCERESLFIDNALSERERESLFIDNDQVTEYDYSPSRPYFLTASSMRRHTLGMHCAHTARKQGGVARQSVVLTSLLSFVMDNQ
jgi:hypothetical protein